MKSIPMWYHRTYVRDCYSARETALAAIILAGAVVSVVGCSNEHATAPSAPSRLASSLSMEATSTLQTCERFGQVQTQSSCMQIKSLEADLRLLALDEATRLQSQFGFSNECHQIGIAIERVVESNQVFEVPYHFADPSTLKTATGDYHPATPDAPDEVHISRGWDALNPDRGPDAIKETFRHELAHSVGVHHFSSPTTDQVAALCGPSSGGGGPGGPPDDSVQPTALPGTPILR